MEEKIYVVPEAEVVKLEDSVGVVNAATIVEPDGSHWTGYY